MPDTFKSWPYFVFAVLSLFFIFIDPTEIAKLHTIIEPPNRMLFSDRLMLSDFFPFRDISMIARNTLVLILYAFLSSSLGMFFLKNLFSSQEHPWGFKLAAGFAPGYLITVVFNRIATVLFPHHIALWVIFVSLSLSCLYIFSQLRNDIYLNLKKNLTLHSIISLFAIVSSFCFFLIVALQQGGAYLIGDGTLQFVDYLDLLFANYDPNAHFVFFDQHYDEFTFLYPVLFLFRSAEFSVICFWALNAMTKVSIFVFIFLLLRQHCSKVFSLLSTFFLFFATFSLSPLNYVLLFDAQNPLFITLHAGRLIGNILPLFMLQLFENLRKYPPDRSQWFFYVCLFFFSAGVATTSIHNLFYFCAISIGYMAYVLFSTTLDGKDAPLPNDLNVPLERWKWRLILLMALGVLLTYGVNDVFPNINFFQNRMHGIVLFVSIILGFVLLGLFFKKDNFLILFQKARKLFVIRIILIMLVSFSAFSFLFGNIPTEFLQKTIEKISLTISKKVSYFPEIKFEPMHSRHRLRVNEGIFIFRWGDTWQKVHSSESHSKNILNFISHYGVILIITFISFIIYSRKDYFLHFFCSGMITLFMISLFFYDFVLHLAAKAWLTARFIETPFYTLWMLFFVAISKIEDKKIHQRVVMAFMSCWIIVPFINNRRFEHWWVNFQYFMKLLLCGIF